MLTAGGVVEYVDYGTRNSPVILALHGGMGGYDHSWFLARALIPNIGSYRVIALSRPGYLGTSQSIGRTPEEQADLYAHLLETLEIDQALTVAISGGGPSALQFALRHPTRCTGLILVSCVTGPLLTASQLLKRLRKVAWLARVPGLIALLRWRITANPFSAAVRSIGDPLLAAKTLEHPIAGPLFKSVNYSALSQVRYRLPGTISDTEHFLTMAMPHYPRIRTPILAIHGEADQVVPNNHARQLVSCVQAARYLALPEARHMALFSHIDVIRSAVAEFLDSRFRSLKQSLPTISG